MLVCFFRYTLEISWTFDVQAKTSPGVEKTHIAKLRTKMKEWPKKSCTTRAAAGEGGIRISYVYIFGQLDYN